MKKRGTQLDLQFYTFCFEVSFPQKKIVLLFYQINSLLNYTAPYLENLARCFNELLLNKLLKIK